MCQGFLRTKLQVFLSPQKVFLIFVIFLFFDILNILNILIFFPCRKERFFFRGRGIVIAILRIPQALTEKLDREVSPRDVIDVEKVVGDILAHPGGPMGGLKK